MAEFVMPILGADMEAGTLVTWRKQPGDEVRRGDIIAEVETDKADIEVEIFMDGVLDRILVEPGEKVPVGTPLAVISVVGAEAPPPAAAEAEAAPPPRRAERERRKAMPPEAGAAARAYVSPAARALAQELGVDLETVKGSGPDGRVQRRDVLEAAATARAEKAPPVEADARQARMRQAIAAAMQRSAREIPHFHIASTIDLGRSIEWLTAENEQRPIGERVLYGVLLVKAVALALHEVPELNAVWTDAGAERRKAVHVGVAISLRGGGLVAPALHDTDRQSLPDLMRNFRDLVQRARAGSLRSSEMSDPTITVTSLGETGAETVMGLIYPPQVALVGFGRVTQRVVPIERGIGVRPTVTATLSADHRVIDGHRGSVFLAALDRLLQEPEGL
jgi:pyruvate dehydrogenase E2 component (dihydrolipoamide acetyltransferase)